MSEEQGVADGPVSPPRNYARSKHRTMTRAEVALWEHIRAGRLDGRKFKRRVQLGDYFVDFLCRQERLAIVLDEGEEDTRAGKSANGWRSDEWLRMRGYTVVRFSRFEVLRDGDAVLSTIRTKFSSTAPRGAPASSTTGEGSPPSDTP